MNAFEVELRQRLARHLKNYILEQDFQLKANSFRLLHHELEGFVTSFCVPSVDVTFDLMYDILKELHIKGFAMRCFDIRFLSSNLKKKELVLK